MKREPSLGELKRLIALCGKDNLQAKQEFQALYGKAIYNFPVKVFRIEEDRAGDFYLYAFENNRIFRRLRNFRGERIGFESYLNHFVLRDLALEWLRKESSAAIHTTPLEDPKFLADENCEAYREDRPNPIELLKKGDWLILRILYLYELPLPPKDIRRIATKSDRSIADTVKVITRIEKNLFERAEKQSKKIESLSILYSRRLQYQRRFVTIEEDINLTRQNGDSTKLEALQREKEELLRKYAWRLEQAGNILEKDPDSLVTTPYKDIAELLGTSTGAISSMIYKAKARFKRHLFQ